MQHKLLTSFDYEEESDARSSKYSISRSLKKTISSRKQSIKRQQSNPHHYSQQTSSMDISLDKMITNFSKEEDFNGQQITFNESLPNFTQKYLPKGGAKPQDIYQEMFSILTFKQRQIQSLLVYRDQLKFISYNNPYQQSIKISIRLLQNKAEIQAKLKEQRHQIQQEIRNLERENRNIKEYTQLITENKEEQIEGNKVIDIDQEREIMMDNIRMETLHFVKELQIQKRRNQKEIRQIQDEIFNYRVMIKEKQDKIRELKAKVCTLYIKMHSRNPQRSGSKDHSMSISIRKFNLENNQSTREVFIGNHEFKKFSKELLEKVNNNDELVKIKFFVKKEKLYFQCIYQTKIGIVHYINYDFDLSKGEIKNPNPEKGKLQQTTPSKQIHIKYLLSMKFYFKSTLVGVQCRIKTDKGNKHVQIGNCSFNLQSQLLTLVNKRIRTLGSYWHGMEMIGISVWYKEEKPILKRIESSKRLPEKKKTLDTQDQYYA